MQAWALEEMKGLDLGDKRLEGRTVFTIERIARNPEASVPQACGDWPATKGAYRLWSNQKANPGAIIGAHCKSTVERINDEAVVLIVQDTSNLTFTGAELREGMGYLDPYGYGLKMHTSMAVTGKGVPLGIVGQKVWARQETAKGKRKQRKDKGIKEKESYKWIEAFEATQQEVPEGTQQVNIADREADIYDYLAVGRKSTSHVLIRGIQNRKIEGTAGDLYEALQERPIEGKYLLEVGRRKGQPPRKATIAVRYGTFEIKKPRNRKNEGLADTITIQAIWAEEEAKKGAQDVIQWLLITTLPIYDIGGAFQYIRWYSYRWLIERYHFILKSGCGVERLQLADAESTHRAVATYSIVAWRLLWMTYEARLNPQSSCEVALAEDEWKVLYMTIFKTNSLPQIAPNLRDAIRWIAQLGGFLGRKGDGDPGVKTLWRGYRALQEKVSFWQLLKQMNPAPQ